MAIDIEKIVENQKILETYSSDYTLNNDVRVAIWQANKNISNLVGELAKYKAIGSYEDLQRLADNASDLERASTQQSVTVWTQERVDNHHVKKEKFEDFDNINNAIQFMKGAPTKEKFGGEVIKLDSAEIEKVEMLTIFDHNKLLSLQNKEVNKDKEIDEDIER